MMHAVTRIHDGLQNYVSPYVPTAYLVLITGIKKKKEKHTHTQCSPLDHRAYVNGRLDRTPCTAAVWSQHLAPRSYIPGIYEPGIDDTLDVSLLKVYRSANRLGYCISIPSARGSRRVKLSSCRHLFILTNRFRCLYNSLLF